MVGRSIFNKWVHSCGRGSSVEEGGISVCPAHGCTAVGDPELTGSLSPG